MIQIVTSWTTLGQTEIEDFIIDILDGNVMTAVEGYLVQDLISDRNDYLQETVLDTSLIELHEAIWPTRKYYIYYAYHQDSSVSTTIEAYELDAEIYFAPVIVRKNKGVAVSGFFSEVIIFRLL